MPTHTIIIVIVGIYAPLIPGPMFAVIWGCVTNALIINIAKTKNPEKR